MKTVLPKGFTLIELLVVIAIIGILASVVLASLSDAREAAKISTAQQQLNQIRNGIFLLFNDTGKGPNGCPFGQVANPEINLNNAQAGLVAAPTPADLGWGCIWTASDISKWNGPYFSQTIDPWERNYTYDPDYIAYQNCSTQTTQPTVPALVSLGEDGLYYTCDDVFLPIK